MRVPKWFTIGTPFVPLDLLRSVEWGIAPYIAGLVTLGGRTTRDGHLKALAQYFHAESQARPFTLGLES